MKYDLDPDTKEVLAAVIAGEDVEWQYFAGGVGCWVNPTDKSASPIMMAGVGLLIRLKPQTIRIGEYDVPEPMRVAPAIGTVYYLPNIIEEAIETKWGNDSADKEWLNAGLCQATREGAVIQSKALRSLTQVKAAAK